jgi:hypothetical protein
MAWIEVTDDIELLETEPSVTAIQCIAVDLTTAMCGRCRKRGRSIRRGELAKTAVSLVPKSSL